MTQSKNPSSNLEERLNKFPEFKASIEAALDDLESKDDISSEESEEIQLKAILEPLMTQLTEGIAEFGESLGADSNFFKDVLEEALGEESDQDSEPKEKNTDKKKKKKKANDKDSQK